MVNIIDERARVDRWGNKAILFIGVDTVRSPVRPQTGQVPTTSDDYFPMMTG